ncbi:hypothetical protein KIPB_009492 [Kipferlia bialata]|uniref:Uncharacterized protein n=1 Tax=Kipferlia bialata TaxID=797122 RepID=A0A9K3GMB6_9EUKA|nr:hypothetical protein KIPB_009492 [Kipferlia bialata]|eukprot:g9492.t1
MRPTPVLSGSSYRHGARVRHVDEAETGILVRDNKNGAVYVQGSLEEVVGVLSEAPGKQLHKQCATLLVTLERVAKDHRAADTLLAELQKIPPTTDAQMEEEQCEVDCLEFRLQRMKKRTQAERDAVRAQIATHKQRLATMLRQGRERKRLSRDLAAYTHLPKVSKALGVPQTPMCEEVSNREALGVGMMVKQPVC